MFFFFFGLVGYLEHFVYLGFPVSENLADIVSGNVSERVILAHVYGETILADVSEISAHQFSAFLLVVGRETGRFGDFVAQAAYGQTVSLRPSCSCDFAEYI